MEAIPLVDNKPLDLNDGRYQHLPTSVPVDYALKAEEPAAYSPTASSMSAFPVPTDDKLTVNINVPAARNGTLEIIDVNGRIVYREAVQLVAGSNQFRLVLRPKGLNAGIYYLRALLTDHATGHTDMKTSKVILK